YLITLTGVCRFAIQKELPTVGGYRRVVPDFARFRSDMDTAATAGVDRQRLLKALQAYFNHQKISIDPGTVMDIPDDKLVTSLAMVCPFEAKEKQALLEAADLAERSRAMTALRGRGPSAGQDDGLRH